MSTKSDPKDAVVRYLKVQNRPYSANDITQNLHKEFGKAAIQKALDELVSKDLIKEKIYGKQKVYAPVQDELNRDVMETALVELDSQIAEASNKLSKVEQDLKTVEGELKEYSNQTSTEDAIKLKAELITSVERLRCRLKLLTESAVQVSADEKNKIIALSDKTSKEYRKRKKICLEIADAILENYPKSKKAFYEEVGIEPDEQLILSNIK